MQIQIKSPLYGKAKTGKYLQWTVYVDQDSVIVEYGQVGGKLIRSSYTTVAKNIGKSNQTTAAQQAIKEAEALWNTQQSRNLYRPTIEELDTVQFFPMLAHDYTKHMGSIVLPSYVQPKLDGVRALFDPDGKFMSRRGVEYKLYDLLYTHLEILNSKIDLPNGLDGELYAHGLYLQQINSLVKNKKKPLYDRMLVKYCIFDIPDVNISFEYRRILLLDIARIIEENNLFTLSVVLCEQINTLDELETLQTKYVSMGYEGIMIRNPAGMYVPSDRSYDLLKYKKFKEKEFKIVGVEEDKDGQAVFVCLLDTDNTKTFNCKIRGTDEFRLSIIPMQDTYIGKWLTIRYQDRTMDDIPTFGVGINVRDCDKNGNPLE